MNNETSSEVLEKTALLQKMRSVPEQPYLRC